MFMQDPTQIVCAPLQVDLLYALAAIFYVTYDLTLFKWGKLVPTDEPEWSCSLFYPLECFQFCAATKQSILYQLPTVLL